MKEAKKKARPSDGPPPPALFPATRGIPGKLHHLHSFRATRTLRKLGALHYHHRLHSFGETGPSAPTTTTTTCFGQQGGSEPLPTSSCALSNSSPLQKLLTRCRFCAAPGYNEPRTMHQNHETA